MGRQTGLIQIEGTIGGIIFYKSKHGHLTRQKGGISKERIAHDASFARTRESGTEFGYASRLGKLLRQGISCCCPGAENGDTNFRLTARLMKIVQQDGLHVRGQRRLTPATASVLDGFEWKEPVPISQVLPLPVNITINPANRMITCGPASFLNARDMRLPVGSTHVELTLAVVIADDATWTQENAYTVSPALALDRSVENELLLSCPLPVGTGSIIVSGIGVQPLRQVNGAMFALKQYCGFGVVKAAMWETGDSRL